MEHQTLILDAWFRPHKIVPWQRAIQQLVLGKIRVIETYHGEVVRSAYSELDLPSVACLTRAVRSHKKGVKFSRVNVFTRDRFTCQYCGRRLPMKHLNYDHVLPRVRGGKTVWTNIVTSCYADNERKGKRTPEEAGMKLLSRPVKPDKLPLVAPVWKTNLMPEAWGAYLTNTQIIEEVEESA